VLRPLLLDLAAAGHRFPIAAHLVLHRQADPEAVALDGKRLADVIEETARTYATPLAVPLMDLTLEKAALLAACGMPESDVAAHHFTAPPPIPAEIPLTPRMRASRDAIDRIAARGDLVALGMVIGPFSLTTKLISDPITPVFLAGSGASAADDPDVALLDAAHALAERVVLRHARLQVEAGAKGLLVCEPAANTTYFSPLQLARSYDVFERYVMQPMRRLTALLEQQGAELLFHDCGELIPGMVERFTTLGAVMISFGSSRRLWEDAALVPKDTVLYGNLPTRLFYSPQLTGAEVERLAAELFEKMRAARHPFILGSECDVLSVPGAEAEILSKLDACMRPGRDRA
jgi:uroporphyrinogen-III decarboxylase